MNSILRHVTHETIAATLITMRSGKKEIILVVEGSKDISLFSNLLSLSKSNFLSCGGKERLMALYAMQPRKGLDEGTFLFRDRDWDGITTSEADGVTLFVTDLYDVEMHLLNGRLFTAMVSDFLGDKATPERLTDAFSKVVKAAAYVGALRRYAAENELALDFDGLGLGFINPKTWDIDVPELVRLVSARSKVTLQNSVVDEIVEYVEENDPVDIASGKDVIDALSLCLSRHYRCCDYRYCEPESIGRILRIAATLDDIKTISFYSLLKEKVSGSAFAWTGAAL